MESRPERGTIDDAQKAKLIFISLAAVVTILLVFSYVSGNKARTQRDAAIKEIEALKEDNAKLSQWLEERTQESDKYKKAWEACKAKPKAKPAVKKPAAKSTAKKKKTKGR
jgi:regulatory protein YycI of two-component signal transduction system YycFG